MKNWNTRELFADTRYRTIARNGLVQRIFFENEPYFGKPTEVFAYLGIPPIKSQKKVPGMVCVHGGGGKAFKEWVDIWVRRGYAAIAMDLGARDGNGKRQAYAGPEQDYAGKFSISTEWRDLWTYHAVAAVIRSHNILRALPDVNPERIGITGISWGGYLTCITAGIDRRFACAMPVYGCGFLQRNSADIWMQIFAAMTPAQRRSWHAKCDPSKYMRNITAPLLFVTGTNDFAYPLDIVQASCALPGSPVTMCVRIGMAHGHKPGWSAPETAIFADHHLRGEAPLPEIGTPRINADVISAPIKNATRIRAAMLAYTTDRGRWQDRAWQSIPTLINSGHVHAKLPPEVSTCYLAVEDERHALASSSIMATFPSA